MSKQKKLIILLSCIGILAFLLIGLFLILVNDDPAAAGDAQHNDVQMQQGTEASATTGETGATKPAQTDPTKETQQSDNKKDPTDPSNTDPTTGKTDPTDPSGTQGTEPTQPGQTDPSTPNNTEPTNPGTTPTEPSSGSEPDPTDPPPSVEIPDDDEEEGLQFPCDVPGYDLRLERLAPYTGMYVENGSNTQVTGVAMMQVRNMGQTAVEYMEINVKYANETLVFHISALPAGETVVVQEKSAKTLPSGVAMEASALVVQLADMDISEELSVTDNGDNTLTIKNLTNKTIPVVRVFYKYYMKDEDMFVGGIAFTVRIGSLKAGGSVTVQPAHYISETSRVVMARTYDS